MKLGLKKDQNSTLFTLFAYGTAVLTIIPIILQAINQYIILPDNIKSILNNIIIIALFFLSITIFLLVIIILPIYIYKKRKIPSLKIEKRKDSRFSTKHQKSDSSFEKNPIEYFMKSLQDDEITETLK